jgi:hypothetical protein
VLTLLHRSELGLRRRSNVVEFYVELDPHVPLGSFLRSAKSCGLELNGILKEYDSGYGEDSLAFMVTIRGKKNLHRDEIIQTVRQFEGIRHLERRDRNYKNSRQRGRFSRLLGQSSIYYFRPTGLQ